MKTPTPFIGQDPENHRKRRLPKLPLIIVALLAGGLGVYALISSFADTPNSNCFSAPSICGYPDATNTGVPAGTTLTPSGSITASTAGQVINAMDVTGTITIAANNVTVQNTRVTLNSGGCGTTNTCGNYEIFVNSGVTGAVIKNSELRAASGVTCEHDIRNVGGSVSIIGDYLHGCDSNLYNAGTASMTDTYGIANQGLAKPLISTDHIENIYFSDDKVDVEHSTLLNPVEQTAVIFGNVNGGSGGTCKNQLTVNNSLLAGGGYTVYPCGNGTAAGSSSVSVTNNHFARCLTADTQSSGGNHVCKSGPDSSGYYPNSGSYSIAAYYFSNQTWSGNVWDNNLQAVCADGSNGCGSNGNPVTPPSDTTPPTVSLSAPANNATVSGSSVTVSANATDNVGVAGVQFKLDGNNLGAEITANPYSTTWDTTGVANGTHTLTAVARDAAGNKTTSSTVTVTVNNTVSGGGGTGGAGCTVSATAATFASVFNSAGSGAVICLAAGSYGTFNGAAKSGMVTIQPQAGLTVGQVSMTINFTAASNITVNGVTVLTGSVISGSKTKNITIENSDFPGQITLDASTLANANILFNHNVHHDFHATGDQEGRIFVPGGDNRPTVGVTIENSQFLNGNSDGIQNGANGLQIIGNEFNGIVQVDSQAGVHADSIQLYGSQNTLIKNNYFHDDTDGIMCADGCDHETVTNNVFNLTTQDATPFTITMLSDNGSTITHNTFVNGSCPYNLSCGIVKLGNKSGDPVSKGTILMDNILSSDGVSNGQGTVLGLASEDYNLYAVQKGTGAHDILGKPTYVGGANPTTYAGFALATGSLGKGTASDGTDRGINISNTTGGGGSGSDTTAPTTSFASPANGATVSGVVTSTANASDNVGVAKVEFYADGASTPVMTDTSSPYNYSFDSKTLANGSHTLTAKAYDAAGNTGTATVTFTVSNTDTTPPTTPAGLKATATNATTVNLSWTASTDASGITKYNVLRNGIVIAQPTTTSYTDSTAVASTAYTYTVQAMDGAGNVSANSAAVTVTTPSASDTTAPSVPANVAATATSASQVNLTWNASTDTGGSGLAGYNVYRNGTKINSSIVTTATYGDATVSPNTAYTYTVQAVDGAGNTSAKSTTVTVTTPPITDTTAPTVSIIAPAASATVSGSSVTVSANATDNVGVAGVQFKLDGNNLGAEITANPYSTTWDTTGVANGTHTLTAVARDAAGNTKTSSSVTVTVNNSTGSGGTGGTQTKNCFSVPSACGYPDATNTGVTAGTTLTPSGSITASTQGQVINAKNVTGTITVAANNVTIQNSKVTLNSGSCGTASTCGNYTIVINTGVSGTIIKNVETQAAPNIICEFDIRNNSKSTSSNTLQLVGDYLHACDSNLFTVGTTTMSDTYGLSKRDIPSDHVENIYFDNASFTANHNTLFNPIDETAIIYGNANGGSGGSCTNQISVTNNLLAGGGYTIYPCGNATSAGTSKTVVTNNHFARCVTAAVHNNSDGGNSCKGGPDANGYYPYSGHFGISEYYFENATTWSGNVWDDNLQAICEDGSNGCAGSGGGGSGGDTTKPTVSFTAPASNTTISGTVSATATASDNVGVTKVEFYADGASTPATTDTASPYNYSFNTLTLANGSHTLTAKAYDAAGNVGSTTVTFSVNNTDITAPNAPTGLKATATNATTVNLSWNASTDTGTGATGVVKYNVLRNGVVIAQPTTTSYTDTSVVAGTAYTYTVQAMDTAGNVSANSAAASVTTPSAPDTTPPSVPANVTAGATSATQVDVSWNASTDNKGGSGLAGYNVYRNGTKLNDAPLTGTTYGDATVSADTAYTYTVQAVDGAGNTSAQSTAITVTTPPITTPPSDTTPPRSPGHVRAHVVQNSSVTLTWHASTDNSGGSGLAGYNVYRGGVKLNPGGPITATSYSDSTVSPGTTYTYTIEAVDKAGNQSAQSKSLKVTLRASGNTGSGGGSSSTPTPPIGTGNGGGQSGGGSGGHHWPITIWVVDTGNHPIRGAHVSFGGHSGTTDQQGAAHFNTASAGNQPATVTYKGKQTASTFNVKGAQSSSTPQTFKVALVNSAFNPLLLLVPIIIFVAAGGFLMRPWEKLAVSSVAASIDPVITTSNQPTAAHPSDHHHGSQTPGTVYTPRDPDKKE